METDSAKRLHKSIPRERPFAFRYPFAAEAEILDLKSGTRLSGMTSDLSLGGCFVCTRRPLEVGTRVHLTLKYKNHSAIMLAEIGRASCRESAWVQQVARRVFARP